jgi:short-subunit dehydrogenase
VSKYPFHTALVTGASSGIGEAMVEILDAAGVATVVVARRVHRLEAVADRLQRVEVIAADLTMQAGVDAVGARISDIDRPIDLVVNNAGFGTSGDFHLLDLRRLTDEVDLNVRALTQLSHVALEVMVPRGRGWLLNVSSVASFQPAPTLAVYAATKAYVTSLTESLHEEVLAHGVNVTALCPGLTRTEFQSVSNVANDPTSYPGFVWADAHDVASYGLDSVARNRAVAVPGALYKALVVGSALTPRPLARKLAGLARNR